MQFGSLCYKIFVQENQKGLVCVCALEVRWCKREGASRVLVLGEIGKVSHPTSYISGLVLKARRLCFSANKSRAGNS
jgi:hypothetical protein